MNELDLRFLDFKNTMLIKMLKSDIKLNTNKNTHKAVCIHIAKM